MIAQKVLIGIDGKQYIMRSDGGCKACCFNVGTSHCKKNYKLAFGKHIDSCYSLMQLFHSGYYSHRCFQIYAPNKYSILDRWKKIKEK